MTLTEAREIVKLYPKQIGDFRRDRITGLKWVRAFYGMQYSANSPKGARFGVSNGDGHVYGCKLVKTDMGQKILVPDTDKVLA